MMKDEPSVSDEDAMEFYYQVPSTAHPLTAHPLTPHPLTPHPVSDPTCLVNTCGPTSAHFNLIVAPPVHPPA